MPARQIGKPKISYSNTAKAFDAISNGFEHPANLPIDSLPQHDAQTRWRDRVKALKFCALAIERNSAQQFVSTLRIPWPIQRDLIFLVDLEARVGESLRQFAVVRQKEQPFSLGI
jgi:hypothetical protein